MEGKIRLYENQSDVVHMESFFLVHLDNISLEQHERQKRMAKLIYTREELRVS